MVIMNRTDAVKEQKFYINCQLNFAQSLYKGFIENEEKNNLKIAIRQNEIPGLPGNSRTVSIFKDFQDVEFFSNLRTFHDFQGPWKPCYH